MSKTYTTTWPCMTSYLNSELLTLWHCVCVYVCVLGWILVPINSNQMGQNRGTRESVPSSINRKWQPGDRWAGMPVCALLGLINVHHYLWHYSSSRWGRRWIRVSKGGRRGRQECLCGSNEIIWHNDFLLKFLSCTCFVCLEGQLCLCVCVI